MNKHMKRISKISGKIVLGFMIFIVIIIGIMFIPIKKADKIDTVKGSFQKMTSADTKIFCVYVGVGTGSSWRYAGVGNKIFNEYPKDPVKFEEETEIILKGNYPKNVSTDILHEKNIYIFEGNYEGQESYVGSSKRNVFNVKRWTVVAPIKRKDFKYFSKDYITVFDQLYSSDEIPNR